MTVKTLPYIFYKYNNDIVFIGILNVILTYRAPDQL